MKCQEVFLILIQLIFNPKHASNGGGKGQYQDVRSDAYNGGRGAASRNILEGSTCS